MIGDKLKEVRETTGMNKKDFAEYIGIKYTTYNGYETGTREPASDFLILISTKFDVSIDYLLGLQDTKEIVHAYQLKASEHEHIEKYRFIAQHSPAGAEMVDAILNREHDVAVQLSENRERILKLEASLHKSSIPLRIYTYMHKIAAAGTGFYFEDIPTDTIEAPYRENADFIIGVSGDSMEPTYSDGDLVYVEKCQTVETGSIGIFILNKECLIKEAGEDGLVSHNQKYGMIPGSSDIICVGKVLGKVELG